MKRNDLVKTLIIMLSTVIATVGLALLLNLVTGQKIAQDAAKREELAAQQAAGVLVKVLPGATGFEEITSTLTIDPTSGVTAVHKETSGKGYVFVSRSTFGNMTDDVVVTLGVDMEGKITGIDISFVSSKDFPVSEGTLNSFVGQDSTLNGVEITADATHSSNAIKAAVSAGFEVLASNKLMEAAKKAIEQIFEESISTLYKDFVKKGEDLEVEGNIYTAYTSYNGSVVVCYVTSGEEKLLVLANTSDVVKVYKANLVDEEKQTYEFVDVTSENESVVTEVKAFVAKKNLSKQAKLLEDIEKFFVGATDFVEVKVPFLSDVLAATSFTHNGATYYGFYTRPNNSFDNSAMDILVVLDSEGKIAKVNIEEFFVNQHGFEYVVPSIGTFNKGEYANGFNGITGDAIVDGTFEPNGDYYITGATKTSLGIKAALTSSFAVFDAIQGGNN